MKGSTQVRTLPYLLHHTIVLTHDLLATATRSPLEEQDHILFNTARLINCGFFMNIIISDYIGAILGLTRVGSTYSLNPLEEIRGSGHTLVGRGEGNACSVEFNLLYRWHATLSAADEAWTEGMMRNKFGGADPKQVCTVSIFIFGGR
jgi:linoleate 10R-lipoxygenase